MSTRRFSTTRLASLTVLALSFAVGSQAFVPSAYGCGQVNSSECRTSTNGGGSGKVASSDSAVIAFLEQVRGVIDISAVLIP